MRTFKFSYTLTKIAIAVLLITFSACSRSVNSISDQESKPVKKQKNTNSISIVDGKYKINNLIVLTDKNKKTLLADLEADNLTLKNTKEEIPGFIKAFLNDISSDKKFDIANPNEEWQSGCVSLYEIKGENKKSGDAFVPEQMQPKKIPNKQLVYFGAGKQIALLAYYVGGIGRSEYVSIIKFKNEKVIDYWYDHTFNAVTAKDEIMKFLKQKPEQPKGGC